MKKNTLKTLEIMVLSTALLASTVTGCGSKETADVPATEAIEAVVETEVVEETETAPEATEEVVVEDTEMVEATEVAEEATFTVTDMSATKYVTSSVKVRSGASTDYEQIGSLTTNQQVTVTGQADTGWYRIEYKGEVGYVSNKYLSDTKVAVNTSTGSNSSSSTNGTTGTGTSTQTQQSTATDTSTWIDTGSSWTGDASTSTVTPSVDTSASTGTQDATTSTPSTGSAGTTVDPETGMQVPEGVLDNVITIDPSQNPVEDLPDLGGWEGAYQIDD